VVVTALYLLSLTWELGIDHHLHIQGIWLGITALFITERIITVRSRGPRQMALAATLGVEMAFDVFLQGVHVKALWDTATNRTRKW
jgi:hypothetical protein